MLFIKVYAESIHALRYISSHLIILGLHLFPQLLLLLSLELRLLRLILFNYLLRYLFLLALLEFLVDDFFNFLLGGHILLNLFNHGLRLLRNYLLRLLFNHLFSSLQIFLLVKLGLFSYHLLQFDLGVGLVKFFLSFQSLLFLLILLL